MYTKIEAVGVRKGHPKSRGERIERQKFVRNLIIHRCNKVSHRQCRVRLQPWYPATNHRWESRNSSIEGQHPQVAAVTLIQTYVEKRGSSNGPLAEQHAGVAPPANRTSCENIFVARVLVLPIVPHLIDHLHDRLVSHCPNETCDRTNRMVKEKHRICVKNGIFQSVNVLRQLGSFPPFGDHFGPG